MKKTYEKPSICMLDYAQKDSLASCSAWINGVIGTGCNSSDWVDQGNAACNPNMSYAQ